MQPSGHRLRDVEHHPLLAENDNYDSSSSSSSEADVADRVWFIRDGCGMVCAVMTWLLVVYADFVVTFVMLLPSKDFWYSVVNGVIFNCLAVLALSSHLRTMLTDPVSSRCPSPMWCRPRAASGCREFLGVGFSGFRVLLRTKAAEGSACGRWWRWLPGCHQGEGPAEGLFLRWGLCCSMVPTWTSGR